MAHSKAVKHAPEAAPKITQVTELPQGQAKSVVREPQAICRQLASKTTHKNLVWPWEKANDLYHGH